MNISRAAPRPGGPAAQRPLAGRAPEILDKLEQPPIWRDRAEEMERARAGVLVGTGVACAAKDYGTGADSSLGSVEVNPKGKIAIRLRWNRHHAWIRVWWAVGGTSGVE
jgi:CO/xanthine dehydrogenase Mo-binding subunit